MDNFPTPDFTFAEPQLPTPPPPPAPRHDIFFGRFGLRAGWGIAIFLVLALIIASLANIAGVLASGQWKQVVAARAQVKAHPGEPRPQVSIPFAPAVVIATDAITFLGILGVCWFFSKAERRRLGAYGLGSSRLADFLPGAFWGLAALSALVFLLRALHLLTFDARLLFGLPILFDGLQWLLAFLIVGFAEEYLLRGYLQYTLTRGVFGLGHKLSATHARLVAFWIAAVFMSILFGALHLGNGGENTLGLLQVVLVGLVFSYALWRTGSLWWAIGFHMAWDWAQSFLYGVPDSGNISVGRLFQTHAAGSPLLSGGVDGPEGSLLCVPILLLVALVIRFTTRPGLQPPLEQQPAP